MNNVLKKTIIKSAVVALVLSAGIATNANAEIIRLSGADRYSTSDAIVKKGWSTHCATAILASGLDANTVDALTVSPLAKAKNAPVVLVDPKGSVANIVAKFKALNTETVYIANGTGVISTDVDAGLKAAGITTVTRLGGASRYETALNIAKTLGASNSIVIANGENAHLVDSLSIAPIAAAKGMPIFLAGSSLDAATTDYINTLGAKTTYVLGGTGVVSDDAVKSLPAVNRLAGAGRYETNAKVVSNFKTDPALNLNNIFIASGEDENLIDALAGAPLAASIGAPIIFVHDNINPEVNTLLKSIVNENTKITELGGVGAVTASATNAINKIMNFSIISDNTDSRLSIVTSANYDNPINFSEGLAVVHDASGFSYIDTNGKIKIGPIKDKVFRESDYQGYSGVISTKQEVQYASDFHEGLAFLEEYDNSPGPQIIIDKSGKEVFQAYDVAGESFMSDYIDGISVAYLVGVASMNCDLVDKNGKTMVLDMNKITGNDYNRTSYLGDGLLAYLSQVDLKWGYVDIKTKKVAIKPQFEASGKFYEGIAPVKLNGKWGVIDKEGKFVINPQYENFLVNDLTYRFQVFTNGIASVEKNGKWGAIDKSGKVVVDFKYDCGRIFINEMACVEKNGKYGYIDTKGKEIIKPQYDDANYFNKNVALVSKNGIYYLIDKENNKVNSETWNFESTNVCDETPDIVSYKQNGKWGIAKITY